MDREKEMAELFQSVINGRVCSYYDFRLLMENLLLNDSNRKRKAKQAIRFLCEKPDAAFVDGKDSLRELQRLDRCPSVLARLEQILKDGEELLKSMLPEIFQPDSPEAAAMQRKFMDALQAEMQRRARDAGEKLYKEQLTISEKHKMKAEIRSILHVRYMEEYSILTTTIQLSLEEQFKQVALREYQYRQKMWEEEQISIVENELLKLIPNQDYLWFFGGQKIKIITPEEGRKQAKELAREIVEIIADGRHQLFDDFLWHPLGGNLGNLVRLIPTDLGNSQIECGDWTAAYYTNLQFCIANWFAENNNSFRIEWLRKFPIFENGIFTSEHNLIRVLGVRGDSVYIDPWASGGMTIISSPEKYGREYVANIENGQLHIYPSVKQYGRKMKIVGPDLYSNKYIKKTRNRKDKVFPR